MPVSHEQALQLLGLESSVTPAAVEAALLERLAQLESRIASAPTDALKAKYHQRLAELEEARTTLLAGPAAPRGLSRTKMADLPLAQAAYTRDGGHGVGGLGVLLEPGLVLAGRYQIAEQIGAGGMGAVYRAFDRNRSKDIAIKVLLPSLLSSPKARERFMAEARLSIEMSHPAIVNVFDVQQDGPHCFLTMELLEGQSLRVRLDQLKSRRERMSVTEALRIVSDVCEGLSYAHSKTVHRDIKPENLWLGSDSHAKIMDFGIARLLEDRDTGLTGTTVGTAYYMPPEQIAGSAQIDGRADQYALAATLYEMLSGQVPTGRIESLRRLRSDVPASVSNAVDRGLSQRASERFEDMMALRRALELSRANTVKAHGSVLTLGVGSVCIAGLVALAWPALRGLLPDRDTEARVRTEAARLQGEARALLRLVGSERQELREAAANAARDAERLDAQLRNARSAEERMRALPELLAAQETATAHAEVERRYRAKLDSAEGLPAIEGRLNVAETAAKAGDLDQAAATFGQAVDALKWLQSIPSTARRALSQERDAAAGALSGKWSIATCSSTSSWHLNDDALSVTWPDVGVYEARVVFVKGSNISAVVRQPESQKGRVYRYQVEGDRLEVEDVLLGRRAVLTRCP